tara:strand:+ start:1053 stop:1871 length:819 start_codon:yes stop_codon:yes gene_type:complete
MNSYDVSSCLDSHNFSIKDSSNSLYYDKSNRNIFLYWNGKNYKLITLLKKLIYLHSTNGIGYNVHLLTKNNINNYIINLPINFYNLNYAHQADYIRVNLIYNYGGIWLDSDTLVLDTLDSLFNILQEYNGFFIRENNKHLINGVFGSKKHTCLLKEWMNIIELKIKNNNNIKPNELGSSILAMLYNKNITLFLNYKIFNGLDNLYPINWYNCVTEFINKPYNNYKNIIREYQPFIILVNSVYKHFENITIYEILNGNMPINYFINKSFENIK